MKYSELNEKRKHETKGMPLVLYTLDKNHPRYVMEPHWHKEAEIIRVCSGKLTVYLNDTEYELSAGDALFVEGGCLKRGYPFDSVYECLVFDLALLDRKKEGFLPILSDVSDLEFKNYIDPIDRDIHKTLDELFSVAREKGEYYELNAVGLLYKLLFELFRGGYISKGSGRAVSRGVRTAIAAIKWIEEHNAEEITLSALSGSLGISEKYLCRLFREYTSKTVMEYVIESRIAGACRLMKEMNITEAAFSSGFNDLSYFSKTFKKHKGMTPSEYRRKYIINNKKDN